MHKMRVPTSRVAKAQLGLDTDELTDASDDLERATGDQRSQIQSELAAHEAAMKKYDSQQDSDGQIAVLSAARYTTLAGRLGAWNRQRSRLKLIQQAEQQALADVRQFTDRHNPWSRRQMQAARRLAQPAKARQRISPTSKTGARNVNC